MALASRCDAKAISTANEFPAQRPIDRLAGQSDRSGNSGDAVAFVVKLANHGFFFFRDLDPCASLSTTPRFAFGFRLGDACQLPFRANFRFRSSDRSQDPGHQPTGRGGYIKTFPQRHKTNAQDLQFIQQRQQPFGGSS
jgi:hypothetical protein